MSPCIVLSLFSVGCLASAAAYGQTGPGSLDSSFQPGSGALDGPVLGICAQGDGKLILAGYFLQVNGRHESAIFRLQPDGSLDDSFHLPVLGGHLHAAFVLPDGRILIWGEFGGAPEFPRIDVARLHPDGSLDPTFDAGESSGAGHVDGLAIQPDGRIILTGEFRSFNRTAHQGVVRLLPDGQVDPNFDGGSGLIGHMPGLVLDGDKILVGGGFTNSQGAIRYGITRLNADGSLDTSFQPSPGVTQDSGPAAVNAILCQPDGKIVIGGNFTRVNGHPCNRIARLNPDGTLDPTFKPGKCLDSASNSSVQALALQEDGKILLAGLFTTVGDRPRRGIARLNLDGSLDTTFDPGTGASDSVKALAVLPDGKMLLGGYFTDFNGVGVGRIARLRGDFRLPNPSAVSLGLFSRAMGDGARFWVNGQVGGSYTIEFSEDLRSWRTLTNFISSETNTLVLDPVPSNPPRRFYRALTPL